jgi:predicted O-methyltransferase YrrM
MHRDFSDNMVNHFEDDSLDFIFIDGLHTYEQVKIDCENYFSKVKSGGVFAGHDYNVIEGVNRAVNEFAAKHGAEVQTCPNDVWYWIKK